MKLAAFFFAASLAAPVFAQSNPILPHPDPFITFDPATKDGKYVLTATGGKDVTLWSGATPITAAKNPHLIFSAVNGMTQIWSPTVWNIDGHWWVYFTAMMPGEKHKIYVLESEGEDVLGSYVFKGALETGNPSIDPSLLVLGGTRYLMYVTVDSGANDIYIRKLKTPLKFDGGPALIAHPEFGWERGEGTSQTYPVNEGPTELHHDGKTFVVYSATHTASPYYCMGLLTLTGKDPMKRASWTKTDHPVFKMSARNSIYGPGRGTFARGKDGTYWLLYAAKTTDSFSAAHRETRAQPFTWNADGSPNFGEPIKDGPIPATAGN